MNVSLFYLIVISINVIGSSIMLWMIRPAAQQKQMQRLREIYGLNTEQNEEE